MINIKTVVLGAGLSGIAAAYTLKENFLVIEKTGLPGGLCTSEHKNGYTFDQTGHWLHMRDDRTKAIFKKLFGENFVEIVRDTYVFSHKVFTQYPFQSNTYGLPPQVIKECIIGFVKAQYENDKSKAKENFYEWCMAYLGEGISKHFMIPYNTKIYTVHPKEYASHWCDYYVPKPTLEQVIDGAITAPEQKNIGYNATFKYPKEGGIGEFPKKFFEITDKTKYLFNVHPIEIDITKKEMKLSDGETVKYENIISSVPLKDFLKIIKAPCQEKLKKISDRMKIASVSYLNVAINKKLPHKGHWYYIPEEKYMPYRLGSFSNIYSKLSPEGKSSLYIEYTHQGKFDDIEKFKQESIKLLQDMKLIENESEIEFMDYRKIENGYVIYHKEYFDDIKEVKEIFAENSVQLIGRYGNWTYSAMENAVIEGIEAAEKI